MAWSALPSIFRAIQPDALAAAIDALTDASHTFGPDVDHLHEAIGNEFGATNIPRG